MYICSQTHQWNSTNSYQWHSNFLPTIVKMPLYVTSCAFAKKHHEEIFKPGPEQTGKIYKY